ncbi:MAG: FAD-binding dehydrogenase [Stappia sp.]|uniref:FAD-dependent oxidoreductase n=1 Tax=Stappia sp. TaxID=1870903 RepID=UPI000C455213|nr:FAD-dependent oxidoreductase [Stappia sp.]MAA97743.1 FAD-binding dehydrogenase [Stappia sp.]MBM20641.1 FAD-binding dehydrogenase [Stappia sp.]
MSVPASTPAPDYDLVVVGSGAAGMAAAITAALGGLSVAILEKASHYGGSTAVSGGAIWIPDNPKMREGGMSDDREAARTYLAGETGNRMNAPLVDAFLENGPEMVSFFEKNTALQFEHRAFSPDYHPDREGAAMGGRVLDAVDYDGRRLGKNFDALRPPIADFTVFGGMMLNRFDIGHFMKMTRSPRSALHAAGLLLRHLGDRLTHKRGTRLVLGQAVAGRLAESVFELGIPMFLETGLTGISKDDGKVTGVRVDHKGVPMDIIANRGVVLATGGFPQDAARRAEHMPHVRAGARHFSMSPSASAGDAISVALDAGGHLVESNSNAAFWTPVSLLPGKEGPRPFPHLFLDRAKPGVIAVGRDGRRFTNEAASYHDFVQGMLGAGHHSAWLICDHRALRHYGLGAVRPFPAPYGHHLRSGYLKQGRTVEELARAIDVPVTELRDTIERFGLDAEEGHDRAFGKGSTAYQTYLGDAENKPNPCLAPLATSPFHAIEIFPGDIGTSIGLETDASGCVLDDKGMPIGGLYACGNDMNSIMAGAYPGAGITLGPALTFGYIVGRHAAANQPAPVPA